ncbi:MAG: hypothetical protein M0024_01200 [Nitrospiraceae bacterium]|nr:hypothetical protein [Nitrospiraceae bacterium]
MQSSLTNRKNAAKRERQQRKLDAGFMDARFPEVADISINMTYTQRDVQKSLSRVVNFFPGSYAVFRIDCLNKECVDGGFDLTQVITGMIKSRKKTSKGNIGCEGESPSTSHSSIAYEVIIQYTS